MLFIALHSAHAMTKLWLKYKMWKKSWHIFDVAKISAGWLSTVEHMKGICLPAMSLSKDQNTIALFRRFNNNEILLSHSFEIIKDLLSPHIHFLSLRCIEMQKNFEFTYLQLI